MFCGNCGLKLAEQANFCSSCGKQINLSSANSADGDLESAPLKSTRNPDEILDSSRSIFEEYSSRVENGKNYKKSLENKWALKKHKKAFHDALEKKAIVRFEGNCKPLDAAFTEICFAENSIVFIAKPGFDTGGIVLSKEDLIHIEVDKYIVRSSLGISSWTQYFWRMHFVTKWADLVDRDAYAKQADHMFDIKFKMKEGEFTFFLPAGKTDYQQTQIEEMILEKLDTLAAFYTVYLEDRTASWNRSVGMMFGTGFWREVGE